MEGAKENAKNLEDLTAYNPGLHYTKIYPATRFQQQNLLNSFNIAHSNINGLQAKLDLFQEFLVSSPELDVVAITETSHQANDDFFSLNINLDSYTSFSIPTSTARGGTTIYIKSKHAAIERTDLNINNNHFEAVWCEIRNKKGKNMICSSIYRHPHDQLDIFSSFLEYMESTLQKLSKENKEVYICGDFNCDMLKVDQNNHYNKFYDLLASYSLFPTILLPTRVTPHSSTIIDNIFTNDIEKNIKSGVIMTDFSDHYSQFVSMKKPKIDYKSITSYSRDYSKFSAESFRDDVSIQNFSNNLTDVNEQFNDFYFRLQGVVDRHAPVKKLTPKEVKMQQKPWITAELRKLIKKKNKLFKRKKRQPNNEDIRASYNELRNKVNRELDKAKKAHYTSYFKENNKNSKKIWDGIKSIINTKNPKSTIINQLKIKGDIIDNPKQMSESFNSYFTSRGPDNEKSIPKNPIANPDKYLNNRNDYEFIIAHTSNEEILEIISGLENKSTGPQSIPVKLLKIIPDLILVPLSRIISTSFSSGIFPDALKISKVIPIHKGGSPEDLNNYRPISLLSIFDKIIEKMMHKRVYSFLEQNNILYQKQFGFRKNNSTTMSLLDITERIKETIDKKKFGCSIFIDLRKAFDTVNHSILLHKLEHYGIRGTALNWFKSYLSNRKQYVYINGATSTLLDITCGVPQGSVLGPLLFLIYINDLPNISKIFEIFLFADDTNLYHEADSLNLLESEINKELKHLHSWLVVNRLSLNIDKTNFVVFYPYNKQLRSRITLKIQKKAIPEKNAVKYLGLMIDSGLTWKTHIDKLAKRFLMQLG